MGVDEGVGDVCSEVCEAPLDPGTRPGNAKYFIPTPTLNASPLQVNYHLARAGVQRRLANFGSDIAYKISITVKRVFKTLTHKQLLRARGGSSNILVVW